MTPSEVLHKAMGFCWHEQNQNYTGFLCLKCDVGKFNGPPYSPNPDYSQPEHIGKVYAWMREDGVFSSFGSYLNKRARVDNGPMNVEEVMSVDVQIQIKLISEWITEG